jgi:hypothetical protein
MKCYYCQNELTEDFLGICCPNESCDSIDGIIKIEICPGRKYWSNGELHRVDGPAIEFFDGRKFWYKNGELHRADGPAVEYSTGYKEYWVNGHKSLTQN